MFHHPTSADAPAFASTPASKQAIPLSAKLAMASLAGAALLLATTCLPEPAPPQGREPSPQVVTSWSSTEMTALGEKKPVMTRVMFGQAEDLAFASSDEGVCTVDGNGVVEAVGDGRATITVSALDSSSGAVASREIGVTVVRKPQNVSLNWSWQGLSTGSSSSLDAHASSGRELECISSDPDVAEVDANGNVFAKAPGEATILAKQAGDNEWQPAEAMATVVVTAGTRDRVSALEPFFEAMRTQQQWSWDATYGGGRVTIENSRTVGNCTTFPTASLQRVGLLGENTIVWPHSRHAKAHPEYFELYDVNATPASLASSGQLLIGDIVRFPNPMHSMVYMGLDEKGHPLWNTAGRVCGPTMNRAKLMTRLGSYEKANITSILRIRTYTVNLSYSGDGIADGGGEVMAKQDCSISFHPQPGHRLSQLVVDGDDVDVSPDMDSYTIPEVLGDHAIEAIFE